MVPAHALGSQTEDKGEGQPSPAFTLPSFLTAAAAMWSPAAHSTPSPQTVGLQKPFLPWVVAIRSFIATVRLTDAIIFPMRCSSTPLFSFLLCLRPKQTNLGEAAAMAWPLQAHEVRGGIYLQISPAVWKTLIPGPTSELPSQMIFSHKIPIPLHAH